jgi:ribosome maturation factor RimP
MSDLTRLRMASSAGLRQQDAGSSARLFYFNIDEGCKLPPTMTGQGFGDDLADRIAQAIGATVVDLGYELVRVHVQRRQRPRLQLMIERRDGRAMIVDDCASVSRAVSAVLDVADPIAGAYTLEVSSPGIDRPLVRLADFDRFAGCEARLELARVIEGRRRLQGRLLGTAGEAVRIDLAGEERSVSFGDIQRAKLVLTDDLLRAAAEQRDGGALDNDDE